jgi:hypothetical protein
VQDVAPMTFYHDEFILVVNFGDTGEQLSLASPSVTCLYM